jgi:polar amino acid transport system substrate-binding protein
MSSVIPSRFSRLALTSVLLAGFTVCAQASTLDKVRDSSSVRIGYANETPFAYAKLAIMSGTVNLAYARNAGISDSQILQVPDTTAQLQAVRAGRADAAVGTQLTMKGLAEKGGSSVEAIAEFKDDPAHTGYGALAFRPEDKELRDAVNAQLKEWIGSEEHLATVKPFGFDQSNITDKTAAELCGQ